MKRSIPPLASAVGRSRRIVAVAGLLLLAGLACATWPLSVRDDLDREVRLEAAPQRLVSLVPSHTETVCALGACERLVGRDTFSDYPPAVRSLPDLGSAFAPDLEALVALSPDLVLVDEFSGAADAVAALGIPVYAGTPQRLGEIFELAERLGALLGTSEAAGELVERLQADLDAVSARVVGRAPPTVFYEVDPSPYSVGPESFIGTLITLAGGANVVPGDLGDFPLVDPEFVVAADPEVIVLADAAYGVDLAAVRARPGWGTIRAVRDGRVYELEAVEGDMLSRAGPRVAEALEVLARLFHPEAF